MKLKRAHKITLLVLCLALAGPELGLGLELIALVNAMGMELILISLTAALWGHWRYVLAKLEEIDPYFFISPMRDVVKCPGLLAHAIPGSMSLLMLVLALTAVAT